MQRLYVCCCQSGHSVAHADMNVCQEETNDTDQVARFTMENKLHACMPVVSAISGQGEACISL